MFEATKLPLTTWFLAIHLLTSTKTNMAALELKRHLGVSYRTAWRLKHKVMEAMMQREEPRQLNGFVQIDDAYLGGERNGGKPGRGSENKQAFVIAIETDANLDHPRFAVIEPVRTFDNNAISDWAQRRLAPEAEAFSDGLGAFRRFETTGHAHTVLKSEGGRATTGDSGLFRLYQAPLEIDDELGWWRGSRACGCKMSNGSKRQRLRMTRQEKDGRCDRSATILNSPHAITGSVTGVPLARAGVCVVPRACDGTRR